MFWLVGRECTYVASVRMWPTSLGGRHPAWPAPTGQYGWCDPARGAGSPEPGWLAVPKRTARAGQPWPARVARAAQPGWPGRPASVLGAPCFESPGVRSTRGPPWTTWSTRAPLLSLAACRQQRPRCHGRRRLGAQRAARSQRSPRSRGLAADEGHRGDCRCCSCRRLDCKSHQVGRAQHPRPPARATAPAHPRQPCGRPDDHPPCSASRYRLPTRSATLLAGLIWPRQSVAARRCRQVDARSVRDVPAGSGTGASGPVAGRRCRWLQPAPRASRAAGPPSRARPRPPGSAAAAWPAGLGRVARRRGGHLRCQDKAHAAVEAACQP